MPGHLSRRRFVQVIFVGGAAAGLGAWASACGSESNASSAPRGTVTLSQLPSDVAALYRYVQANQPLTQRMPCYCGCGEHSGHRSVRDCFIDAKGQYDDHASGCDICLDIAEQTQQLSGQGLDATTIRTRIDQQFGKYGPPTKTQ